jgi:hypothetical protein
LAFSPLYRGNRRGEEARRHIRPTARLLGCVSSSGDSRGGNGDPDRIFAKRDVLLRSRMRSNDLERFLIDRVIPSDRKTLPLIADYPALFPPPQLRRPKSFRKK